MSHRFGLFLLVLITVFILTASAGEASMPKGSYANQPTDAALQNPAVVGILLQSAHWPDIEKSEGSYNWSTLDDDISRAAAAGKAIILNIQAGGIHTPKWVTDLPGVQNITFIATEKNCAQFTIPVFWDPVFLEKKKNFIGAVGQRYASNPNVVGVMVSFVNAYTNEWHIPHTIDARGRACSVSLNQPQDWLDAGYTTEKMLNAGKETINVWAAAFPNQALKLPIGQTHANLDGTEMGLAELTLDWAYSQYPGRFFAQMNGLSAQTPNASNPNVTGASPDMSLEYSMKLLRDHSPQIGLQMISAATLAENDNPPCRQNGRITPCPRYDVLLNSVKVGLSYKASYLEYWHEDAENPELQPVLQYANDAIITITHRVNANQDGCIDSSELTAFIGKWQVDSQDVTLRELMEAIGLWNRGCVQI